MRKIVIEIHIRLYGSFDHTLKKRKNTEKLCSHHITKCEEREAKTVKRRFRHLSAAEPRSRIG